MEESELIEKKNVLEIINRIENDETLTHKDWILKVIRTNVGALGKPPEKRRCYEDED